VVLGPMMMLGSWWETRSVTRRQIATATAHFRSSLADLAIQLAYAHELERAGRRTEHPRSSKPSSSEPRWSGRDEPSMTRSARSGSGWARNRLATRSRCRRRTRPCRGCGANSPRRSRDSHT
jgi:hypothetical protein